MRAAPATIGGMPRSSKRASERQSATSSRSPCTTWIDIAVWPSWKVVKLLRPRGRDRAVALDDALDQPAHRLDAERERDHVEQQQVAGAGVAGERIGLDRRAEGDHLSGSRLVSGARPKNSPTGAAHHRHAGRAADQDDAVDSSTCRPWRRAATWRTAASVRSTKRLGDRLELGARRPAARQLRAADGAARTTARSALDSASLAARAAIAAARRSPARLGVDAGAAPAPSRRARRRCRRRRAPNRRRWRRPRTRPRVMRSSEMSKVPPPRS